MSWAPYYEHVRMAYDSIASQYDESIGQYAVSHRAKKLALDTIRSLTPHGGRLLDIGCYTGIEAIALAREGFQVVGIDLSPQMVNLAQAKAKKFRLEDRVRFQTLEASDLDFLESIAQPFDTAYSVYGTLNLEPRIRRFRDALLPRLKRKAAFVCGLLNPTVLYELLAGPTLLKFHGYGKLARRRVRTRIGSGGVTVETFLYTPREFVRLMGPELQLEEARGLHFLYPPPRGRGSHDLWWVARALDSVERKLENRFPFRSLGFFSLLVFRRV